MAHQSDLISSDILGYLKEQEEKSLLRFITCGSVDDGKSTLIGRLLYDSKLLFEDQIAALEADSKRTGTQGENIDFALLVDGLAAEQEQGITIDVAYRFFSTDKRKFIVADTPGHEQYTRNMATGASTADLAILLVDARHGLMTQTRRHSFIASLLGIKHIVVAVNKMDLVEYDQRTFQNIEADYRDFAKDLGFKDIVVTPISALEGDNIVSSSEKTPWYQGKSLMAHLESVQVEEDLQNNSMRMPVQWVNRPNLDFRGFSGTLASGTVKPGDRIKVLPSAVESTVKSIVTYDGDLEEAVAGEAVTLTLEDEIDASSGDVIVTADDPSEVTDQVKAKIIWMSDEHMIPGRPYLFKTASRTIPGIITGLKHKVDVNTMEKLAATSLELNEIASVKLAFDNRVVFDAYTDNRQMGAFIIIDKMTNATVGAGMIDYALRRASNIHWQAMEIDKTSRATQKMQKPAVLWFTGLSGSGKSTVANLVDKALHARGRHTYALDGDNVRHGLCHDLGFTDVDRVENIRRVGEVAKLMADAGLIVTTSFISPFAAERAMVRQMLDENEFIEVHVNTPIDVCEERDVKGLYKKARAGEIKNFTGIDSPYEAPKFPELTLDTTSMSAEACAELVVDYLEEKGYLSS
ncbi:sulfate adenylyltransferase subunit CysN [Temperatibacter marinus]|uniref:Multifunctional fusion protein n=1 Tax=Temperatibacter marinus TaxID=1456591 RepID=A0AA52HAW8_9PROT|nr:sulfate adenylyltransferase subunit CysN [Temperatibacter marinus]WND03170.1 sulfate adenylyltransferase subunit CysN [Temperatibacter marinus]